MKAMVRLEISVIAQLCCCQGRIFQSLVKASFQDVNIFHSLAMSGKSLDIIFAIKLFQNRVGVCGGLKENGYQGEWHS